MLKTAIYLFESETFTDTKDNTKKRSYKCPLCHDEIVTLNYIPPIEIKEMTYRLNNHVLYHLFDELIKNIK